MVVKYVCMHAPPGYIHKNSNLKKYQKPENMHALLPIEYN